MAGHLTFSSRPRAARRPLASILVAALLGSILAMAPLASAGEQTPFDDVEDNQWFTTAIAWLADQGITTGTSPTTFSPDDVVTRGQMAAFLERYAQTTGTPGEHGFGDVPGGVFFDGPVSFLVEREITTGTSPTTFSPNDPVTRAQMATFLWRFSNRPLSEAALPFIDVPADTWYTEPVRWLADKGITAGTSPVTYSPNDFVTRKQMATFLWRLAGEPPVGDLGANRVDTDTTVVPEEDEVEFQTLAVDGESEFEWTGDDEQLPEVGDAVALGVTDETPEGFLGKVTEVDGMMVTTEPATISDVVDDGDFDSTLDIDGEGFETLGISDVFDSTNASCSSDPGETLTVEPSVRVDGSLDISASWSLSEGTQAEVSFTNAVEASVTITASTGVECKGSIGIDGPILGAFTIFVGPVPLVITPQLSFEAEISGSFAANVSTTISYEPVVTAGMRYDDGEWEAFSEFRNDGPGFTYPTIAAEAKAELQLSATLTFKVNGVGGPYVSLSPFFQLSVQNAIPWWNLDAGVRLQFGVAFDVGFFEASVEFAEFEIHRETLADSGTTPIPGGFVFLNPLPFSDFDPGYRHACGVDLFSEVYCWGSNGSGALGRGLSFADLDSDPTADTVLGIDDAIQVSSDLFYSCAVHETGEVSCWGKNDFGQLGDGTTTSRDEPVAVVGITDAVQVDAGQWGACARHEDFTVSCWGYGPILGDGSFDPGMGGPQNSLVPVKVSGINAAADVSVGWARACAIEADGRVWCWGDNADNSGPTSSTPVALPIVKATKVEVAQDHTCALDRDGAVWCWGANGAGQLGTGDFDETSAFNAVLVGATSVTTGPQFSCATLENDPDEVDDDTGVCWGWDGNEQLGDGDDAALNKEASPVAVDNLTNVDQIVAGGEFACGVLHYGAATCWGDNTYGQLGDGTTTERTTALTVVRNPAAP
ncbi:MAG: S-layer homology domain-containing protein [Actinomycetota bacterium]